MPLIAALGKQRQADLCEFESNLVYKVSSRTARATQRNPVQERGENTQNNKTSQHMGQVLLCWCSQFTHCPKGTKTLRTRASSLLSCIIGFQIGERENSDMHCLLWSFQGGKWQCACERAGPSVVSLVTERSVAMMPSGKASRASTSLTELSRKKTSRC